MPIAPPHPAHHAQAFQPSNGWILLVKPTGFRTEEATMRGNYGRHTFDVRFFRNVPGVGWDAIGMMPVMSGCMFQAKPETDMQGIAHSAVSFVLDEIERGEASEVWQENDFASAIFGNTEGTGHHLEAIDVTSIPHWMR